MFKLVFCIVVALITLFPAGKASCELRALSETTWYDSLNSQKCSLLNQGGYFFFVDGDSSFVELRLNGVAIPIADVGSNCQLWGTDCTRFLAPEGAGIEWVLRAVSDYVITRDGLVELQTSACEVGYLDEWGVSRLEQELLWRSGICLVVDTVGHGVDLALAQPFPECPFWCVCGPKGKCWEKGNECFTCAAAPSPGLQESRTMDVVVNEVVDELFKRLGIQ